MILRTTMLAAPLLALAAVLAVPVPLAADVDTLRSAGKEALRARDYATAAAHFAELVRESPDDAAAWLDLGRARSAQQDWDGAIRAYERTIELQPDNEKAYNNLGNVYFRMGVYDRAGEYYDRALQLRPEYLLALFHHGYVLHRQNEFERAGQRFEACLAVAPRSNRERTTQLDCRFYQGVLAFRADRIEKAVAILEEVLTIHPSHPEANHYLGLCLRRLGRDEEARARFERHRELLKRLRSSPPIRKAIDS